MIKAVANITVLCSLKKQALWLILLLQLPQCNTSTIRHLPYRTKKFIEINVREIRDCQNREGFKPTKNNFHQALHACKQHQSGLT